MAVTLDTYALVDLATAKDHLGIPVATTDYDDKIKRYINSASARIEKYIDRLILKRNYIEYHDGRRTNELLLKQWPSDKPTELWLDSSSLFTDNENLAEAEDYAIHTDMWVILLRNLAFVKGVRNIKVVYDAGYVTVPYDLEIATLWHVEWYWDLDKNRSMRQNNKSKNSESVTYLTEWPEWFVSHLDPYKRCEFPGSNTSMWNG